MNPHQQKKQLERLLIDLFKEKYLDFPKGKILESESPDFIIRTSVKSALGIELVRLYPESKKVMSLKETEKQQLQDELIGMIREQFEVKSAMNCFVKILFDESELITPERLLSVSVKISRILFNSSLVFKKTKPEQMLITKKLPPGIESILFITHPGLNFSVWERSNNLGISSNLLEDIRHSIHKKDEKLELYEKKHLSRYWLLITTDRLCQIKSVNISNILMNNKFKTNFDRVFILELFRRKSYLIK